jgi:hypothetical protein
MSDTFMTTSVLLSDHQLSTLSPHAQRLYTTIWNRLKNRNQKSLWMYDLDVAKRSLMPYNVSLALRVN